MQTHWRLAFMFDARDADLESLGMALRKDAGAIDKAALGNRVRKGLAIREPTPGGEAADDELRFRKVDGAIEVSLPNAHLADVSNICQAMRGILDRIAEPGSIEVMTGTMHHMVPVRRGAVFLSLSFRRFPGKSVTQFREWWQHRHAPMAIPVLTEGLLLAYDQVHVDGGISRGAADVLGVASVDYDAYDNLTFESPAAFQQACSDAAGMARLAEDEAQWIDNTSRRYALMCEILP